MRRLEAFASPRAHPASSRRAARRRSRSSTGHHGENGADWLRFALQPSGGPLRVGGAVLGQGDIQRGQRSRHGGKVHQLCVVVVGNAFLPYAFHFRCAGAALPLRRS